MSKAATNFEVSITDSLGLLESYDDLNQNSKHSAPEVLKRASLIMILTAWETYVEDRAVEIMDVKYEIIKGSPLGGFVENKLSEELKRFHTPDSQKTKKLFFDFTGIDVTEGWVWANMEPKLARTTLNKWIKKRGDAVHRSRVEQDKAHIVKRDELDKCIRFFKELVNATECALSKKNT